MVGRQEEHVACKMSDKVWLSVWIEVHMVQLMPLHSKTPSYLASFKFRLVLPFWYWLTQVVLETHTHTLPSVL